MGMSITSIIDQVNCRLLTCTLSNVELLQLSGTICSLSVDNQRTVNTIANIAVLPNASLNTGRLMFVSDISKYRYSNGTAWSEFIPSGSITTIWNWGDGGQGQLGDCTTVDKSSPVSIVGGFTNWTRFSGGGAGGFTVALRSDGTAWAWGTGTCGRLGDNTTVNKSSPVSVVGGFTNWCAISAEYQHTAALRTDGTAWAWGDGTCGRLGDGTTVNKSSPVSVVGGFTNWCAISAGGFHTAALRTDGTAWAWGKNQYGQLGNKTIVDKSSPISVIGGVTNWCAIGTGKCFTAALRTDGTAWAWGSSATGELGDNTTVDKSSPVSVIGGFTNWCAISAGQHHIAALRTDGTAWTWGRNFKGNLGDGTTVDKSSPVSIIGGFTDWYCVSAGLQISAATRTNGTIWVWGCQKQGNFGNGSCVSDKSSPTAIITPNLSWGQICAGDQTTTAMAIRVC